MQGTNRTGEGGQEAAMWPRIWVSTRREGEKRRAKINTWDGKTNREEKKVYPNPSVDNTLNQSKDY